MQTNYNELLLLCSYLISVAGSFMALLAARQAINSKTRSQKLAVMLSAAVALGGVGIWAMHFVAMLALSIGDIPVSYDAGLTLGSMALAIGITYVGFCAIANGNPSPLRLLAVGFIMGSGITAMHYTGMFAIRLKADVIWNQQIVLLSYIIAVAASVVALWLASNLTQKWQMVISAAVMGVAVCGMHYTGMVAATFVANPTKYVPAPFFTDDFAFGAIVTIIAMGILVSLGVVNAILSAEQRLVTRKPMHT